MRDDGEPELPPAPLRRNVEELLRRRDELDQQIRAQYQQHVAVIFTDIKGSTQYFERYGDLAGRAMVQRHNDLLFPLIADCDGKVVKTIGDAIMAFFDGAPSAVEAAQRMQRALAKKNAEWPERERIFIRIGVHAGEALVDSQDVYGDTVNTAARIEAQAGPEEILISDVVLNELGSTPPPIRRRGAVRLKGKAQETPLFEVLWRRTEDGQALASRSGRGIWGAVVSALVIAGGGAAFWMSRSHAPASAPPSAHGVSQAKPASKVEPAVAHPSAPAAPIVSPSRAKTAAFAAPTQPSSAAPSEPSSEKPAGRATRASAPTAESSSFGATAEKAVSAEPATPSTHRRRRHRRSHPREAHRRSSEHARKTTEAADSARASKKPAAKPSFGSVVFESSPGGDVYVDGRLVGRNIWRATLKISPGVHQIQVRSSQYLKPRSATVDVRAGAMAHVRIQFPAR